MYSISLKPVSYATYKAYRRGPGLISGYRIPQSLAKGWVWYINLKYWFLVLVVSKPVPGNFFPN